MSELDNVPNSPKTYTCGTLTYTKAALAMLFFWLLWGDVCYTLMESVTGPIMLEKFQALHASNADVGLILTTIPTSIYSFLNPIISFKSDRFRSRLGRRIPFILFSLPFLVIMLVGLAYGDRLGFWLHGHMNPFGFNGERMAIWTLGVLLVLFSFFNAFVTSTFWYLFNDVVPEHLLARFMSWFRFIGTGAGAFYSFFIFGYSGTHSTAIFLGAATLYLFGFGLMCIFVREGEYPPPSHLVGMASANALQPAGDTESPIVSAPARPVRATPRRLYWFLWISAFIGVIAGGIALGRNDYPLAAICSGVGLACMLLVAGRAPMSSTSAAGKVVLRSGLYWVMWFAILAGVSGAALAIYYHDIGMAVTLYLCSFAFMCLAGARGMMAGVVTYARECHSHRLYWYLWICTFIGSIGAGVGIFDQYYKQSIGLDLNHIGYLRGSISVTIAFMILGAGWLADRYHPIRVALWSSLLGVTLVTPSALIWLFWHPSPGVVFWISMAMGIGLTAPAAALGAMWDPPMLMRIFPRAQYGTFCSTNAVWRSVGGMLGAFLAGKFIDVLTPRFGAEEAYCFSPVWTLCFAIPSFLLFLKFYQSWKRHGGDDAYVAPVLERDLVDATSGMVIVPSSTPGA